MDGRRLDPRYSGMADRGAPPHPYLVPPDGIDAGWLVCRRVRLDDVDAVYEAVVASADHLSPWMPWVSGYTHELARAFVERNIPQPGAPAVSEASYAICDRSGELLGMCGWHDRLGPGALEIGYWLDVRHTGRGVATLAAAAVTELAFAIPGVVRVEIHHDEANERSGAIPARLGYELVARVRREPEAPAESGVEVQWRMRRGEWPSSRGARLLAVVRRDEARRAEQRSGARPGPGQEEHLSDTGADPSPAVPNSAVPSPEVPSPAFPSPTVPFESRRAVFVGYLDFFRDRVIAKTLALPEDVRRSSRLPSGWTPLELVKHLAFVERRWLEWGFEGRDVAEPWGDRRDDRWFVDPWEPTDQLVDALRAQGARTTAIAGANELSAVGQPGPRWDGAEPATLERVLFHLLQEYARHLGHLDVVAELAGGEVGE